MPTHKERDSNIELLRIITCIGVILLHYNNPGIGGAMKFCQPLGWKSITIYVGETLFIGAVDMFMLISGYFTYPKTSVNLRKVGRLLLHVTVIRFLRYLVMNPVAKMTALGLFRALLPLNFFVITYCAVQIISPYINLLLQKLDRRSTWIFLLVIFLIFSVWPTGVDYFNRLTNLDNNDLSTIARGGSGKGYTFVNYTLLYCVGAVLRKQMPEIRTGKLLLALACSFGMIFAPGYFLYLRGDYINIIYSYCNPFVIVFCAAEFLLFLKWKLGNIKVINRIAAASFTVYLIGNHVLIPRKALIEKAASGPWVGFMANVAVTCLLILAIAFAVHTVYEFVTRPIFRKIDEKCRPLIIAPVFIHRQP